MLLAQEHFQSGESGATFLEDRVNDIVVRNLIFLKNHVLTLKTLVGLTSLILVETAFNVSGAEL